MQTELAQKIFEIHVEELSTWDQRPHKHNFFEIVYIEQGRGIQCINDHEFEYQAGNIFLLPPLDCHSFRITEASRFYFIRFTDHYFRKGDGLRNYQAWFDRITYILANYNRIPGDIIASERERQFIIHNIRYIHQEYLAGDSYSEAIITDAVAAILNILVRSIEKQYVGEANEVDNRFGEILRYLNTHLTEKAQLSVPVLADRFSISTTYFSEYFKKHAGMSLSEYLLRARLRIVETKVLHTDLSLKEISYQLNFSDSSHLSKAFKKVYGMTIGEFKKGGQACRL